MGKGSPTPRFKTRAGEANGLCRAPWVVLEDARIRRPPVQIDGTEKGDLQAPRQLDASFKKLLGRGQAGQSGSTVQSSPAWENAGQSDQSVPGRELSSLSPAFPASTKKPSPAELPFPASSSGLAAHPRSPAEKLDEEAGEDAAAALPRSSSQLPHSSSSSSSPCSPPGEKPPLPSEKGTTAGYEALGQQGQDEPASG